MRARQRRRLPRRLRARSLRPACHHAQHYVPPCNYKAYHVHGCVPVFPVFRTPRGLVENRAGDYQRAERSRLTSGEAAGGIVPRITSSENCLVKKIARSRREGRRGDFSPREGFERVADFFYPIPVLFDLLDECNFGYFFFFLENFYYYRTSFISVITG